MPRRYHHEAKMLQSTRERIAETINISYCCIVCICSCRFERAETSLAGFRENTSPKMFIKPKPGNGKMEFLMIIIVY